MLGEDHGLTTGTGQRRTQFADVSRQPARSIRSDRVADEHDLQRGTSSPVASPKAARSHADQRDSQAFATAHSRPGARDGSRCEAQHTIRANSSASWASTTPAACDVVARTERPWRADDRPAPRSVVIQLHRILPTRLLGAVRRDQHGSSIERRSQPVALDGTVPPDAPASPVQEADKFRTPAGRDALRNGIGHTALPTTREGGRAPRGEGSRRTARRASRRRPSAARLLAAWEAWQAGRYRCRSGRLLARSGRIARQARATRRSPRRRQRRSSGRGDRAAQIATRSASASRPRRQTLGVQPGLPRPPASPRAASRRRRSARYRVIA